VVSFNRIVGVAHDDVQHCRELLVEYPWMQAAVGGHLNRVDADCQRSGEEASRCGQVTA
jgi:hypothetical protein